MSTDVLDRMIGEADALSPDEKRQLRDVLDESLRQDELNKRAKLSFVA
jgi:hypothetical protein